MLINFMFILLFCLFWIIIAGIGGTKIFLFLSIISIIVSFLCAKYLNLLPKKSYKIFNFVLYIFWLLKEIAQSSLYVTKLIWSIKPNIKPTIVEINTNLNELGKIVIYANSITLTPGTLSIDIIDNKILVHSLTTKGLRDLLSGSMEKKLQNL